MYGKQWLAHEPLSEKSAVLYHLIHQSPDSSISVLQPQPSASRMDTSQAPAVLWIRLTEPKSGTSNDWHIAVYEAHHLSGIPGGPFSNVLSWQGSLHT
jgi:hypothetical protein